MFGPKHNLKMCAHELRVIVVEKATSVFCSCAHYSSFLTSVIHSSFGLDRFFFVVITFLRKGTFFAMVIVIIRMLQLQLMIMIIMTKMMLTLMMLVVTVCTV